MIRSLARAVRPALLARAMRPALALGVSLLALGGCAGKQLGPPAYKSVDELEGCAANECVEAKLAFRHWANAPHFRGRMIYHCDPGSELDGRADPDVRRLIIAIHGVIGDTKASRARRELAPGLEQYRNVARALRIAAQRDPNLDRDSIAIVAPTFQSDGAWQPYTDEDRRVWTWKGSTFNSGYEAEYRENKVGWVKAEPVSSFDVIDEFLRAGLIKFPNLESIVLVGHSSGGQTVHRYALAGVGVHEHLAAEGISLRYMPANGGGFAFPYGVRKLPPGQTMVHRNASADSSGWRFGTPRGCKRYDNWPFGTANVASSERLIRAASYAIENYLRPRDRKLARKAVAAGVGTRRWLEAARLALRLQYASREIWHFQAATDREQTYSKDCRVVLQGRSRFERFTNFQQLWTEQREVDPSNLHFVALTDAAHPHSSQVVYASDAGMHVLFY